VPRSQRGGEIIEPMISQQWFVRTKPLAEPALAAVEDGSIDINPKRFAKVLTGCRRFALGGAAPACRRHCVCIRLAIQHCNGPRV
jgi:tRNA synthetases class I (I, L, M and V)